MSKIKLYPNQIFRFLELIEEKNKMFCKILLTNGVISKVEILKPITVEETKTKLVSTTKEELDEAIKNIINMKYNLKKINLTDGQLDEIEEEVDKLKLNRKEKRKKLEELENKTINDIKEKMKKNDFDNFFNSDNVYQANGIFLNEDLKTGGLQLLADPRFKSRNVHSVKNDMPFINFSF